jgi:hypothetical protein
MVPTGEREVDVEWEATEELKWRERTQKPDRDTETE